LRSIRRIIVVYKNTFTIDDCKEFDEWAIEVVGIPSIILMENAGHAVADEIYKSYFSEKGTYNSVTFFCGVGHNGGDGLVAARHLFVKGVNVKVYIVGGVSGFSIDTELNFRILRKLGVYAFPLLSDKDLSKAKIPENSLIVDAIFGTGIDRDIIGFERKVIDRINKEENEVVSIDSPSGFNLDDGSDWGICVKANKTITFVATKKAFEMETSQDIIGDVEVVDIGISVPEKK
jgi:NAD(P)H-hydrate epimerase